MSLSIRLSLPNFSHLMILSIKFPLFGLRYRPATVIKIMRVAIWRETYLIQYRLYTLERLHKLKNCVGNTHFFHFASVFLNAEHICIVDFIRCMVVLLTSFDIAANCHMANMYSIYKLSVDRKTIISLHASQRAFVSQIAV